MKAALVFVCSMVLMFSCKTNKYRTVETSSFPRIIDNLPEGETFFYVDSMQPPLEQGVYAIAKFDAEKIIISDTMQSIYSRYFDELLSGKDSGNIEVLVDTKQMLSIDTLIERNFLLEGENIDDMFNRQEKEKLKNKLIKSFPIFILNKDTSTIEVTHQDGSIMMIQEAKDPNGAWKPIEFWLYSWCGNSYGRFVIPPNYCAVTKIPVYKGDFKTELRLKVEINSNIYYSKPFWGSINLSQFIKTFGEWRKGRFLEDE